MRLELGDAVFDAKLAHLKPRGSGDAFQLVATADVDRCCAERLRPKIDRVFKRYVPIEVAA